MSLVIIVFGCSSEHNEDTATPSQIAEMQISKESATTTPNHSEKPSDIHIEQADSGNIALTLDDFETICQNGNLVNIESIKGGDIIRDGNVIYYGYRLSENDTTRRNIKYGSTIQEVADAYPDVPVMMSGAEKIHSWNSLQSLIESGELQATGGFYVQVFYVNNRICSYDEVINMLMDKDISPNTQSLISDLANISDDKSVISYEMSFYYPIADDDFSDAQTSINFLTIRKTVYRKTS